MAFEVDYFTLDSTNKFVVLSGSPVDSSSVGLDIIGGTSQMLGYDFGVVDSTVKWDNTNYQLYDLLSVGDKIRVIYDKSSS